MPDPKRGFSAGFANLRDERWGIFHVARENSRGDAWLSGVFPHRPSCWASARPRLFVVKNGAKIFSRICAGMPR
jgi:hypothetical protein